MKINLNKQVLDLDGSEIKDANIGKIVAQVLIGETKGDALKYWGWAQKLYTGEDLDLDQSDFETFKTFIKETDKIPVITKAQAIACLS